MSKLSNKYENVISLGNFSMNTSNPILAQLLDTFVLSHSVISPTCLRNSKYPCCINLLLANLKPSFMKTKIFETGISDHYKMISTFTRLHFKRESYKTRYYRDYREFNIDYFSSKFSQKLDSTVCFVKGNEYCENLNEFYRSHRAFPNLFNIHTPLKKKILRGSNSPV